MTRAQLLSGASLLLPKHTLGEPDTRRLVMVCDHPGCRMVPDRAPRVVIPGKPPFLRTERPIRIMTTLHFCLPHAVPEAFDMAAWLTGKEKANIEAFARQHRPAEFKPDFEAAWIEWELVASEDYRKWLQGLGVQRAYTA